MSDTLRGLLTPTVTPFKADFSLDVERYIAHSKRLLGTGCVGLVPFGTTGEALSLSTAERRLLLEELVQAGVPPQRLIVGAGLCNLEDSAQLINHAMELGCAGALVLPPFYYKNVNNNGLFCYYEYLIKCCSQTRLPRIYLYNIPQVAGVGVSVSLMARLKGEYPDVVVGAKDSSGKWRNTAAILKNVPQFAVYPGTETRLRRALDAGAEGCITASGNINAPQIGALFSTEDAQELKRLERAVDRLRAFLDGYPLIPALKQLLAHTTGEADFVHVRPPLRRLPRSDTKALLERYANMCA